jgi:hypothetical protein
VRAVACIGLIVICLAGSGCNLLKKKAGAAAPRGPADNPWSSAPKGPNAAVPPDQGNFTGARNGVLAGQVVDASHRRPPATFIQVVSAQETTGPKSAPIEVAADPLGYFMIQGLQPGQPYELVARAKDGDRMLAGRVWARPPDPKVLIRISEDLATPNTPPVPPPPGAPGQKQSSLPADQDWAPGRGLTTDGRRTPAPPQAPRSAPPIRGPQPEVGAWPPNVISIPSQGRNTPPPPSPPAQPGASSVASPVPSCMLLGDRLHNFALRDLNGQTWEFRQRRGKLVLLDFWYTECIPCQHAIDHLRILQADHAPGLEVVSIAYERGTPEEQAAAVRRVAGRKQINYRLLLGTGREAACPVRDQFQVFRFPTLVLLDEQGQILKRWEGLDEDNLRDLNTLLRHHLATARR